MYQGQVALSLLAFVLVVPGFASAQQSAWYEQGGVEYYMAAGTYGNGTLAPGLDPDAQAPLPFEGCAVVKLRPDTDMGRIRVLGKVDGVLLDLDLNEFDPNGIQEGREVDGSRGRDGPLHPAVPTTVAAWGEATLQAAGRTLEDPAVGGDRFATSFFVTDRGFRDDDTGRIRTPDGGTYEPGGAAVTKKGDWEMHLRFESRDGSATGPVVEEETQPPQQGPVPTYIPPSESYGQVFPFENQRFGGDGTLDVEASSLSPEGTDLTFLLRAPGGRVLHQMNATPGLQDPFTDTVSFPLDRFGDYLVEVRGNVSFTQYTLRFTQNAPERFELGFWWEDVAGGADAVAAQTVCHEQLFGGQGPTGYILDLPPPPEWPWKPVTLTVLGITGVTLAIVVFTMMAWAAHAHRKAARD